MTSVAIIGAGITGLTAAYYLQSLGTSVTVYEAGDRPGGVIRSVRSGPYLAECGPNTILETSPRIAQLIKDVGLENRRIYPDPSASARYLVFDRRPVAMPGSPLGFLRTPMFSARAKLALLREPFVPRRTDGVEESIGEFVVRRLGAEILDRAIDALVAGVYAGDPRKLSLQHAFPRLAALEARYGSLIKGQILGARERRRRGEVAKDRAPKFSFDEGLQVLTDALAAKLQAGLRFRSDVIRVAQTSGRWFVEGRTDGAEFRTEHRVVLYAGTAFRLAELELIANERIALGRLAEIRYPPVASVVLGFRREDVEHPCSGFGVLIPGREGFNILGTIFSSALFPNRAPSGHITLTSYLGGERQPELAGRSEPELERLTREDLKVLLGVRGEPTFRHFAQFPRAIPQYNVGFGRFRDFMTQVEQQAPGFFLAGHYRDGVSLSDSIVAGCQAADRIAAFVAAGRTAELQPA